MILYCTLHRTISPTLQSFSSLAYCWFIRQLTIQAALMKSLIATIAEHQIRIVLDVPTYLRNRIKNVASYFTNRFLLLFQLLYRVKPERAVLFHQSKSFRFMKRRLRESMQCMVYFYLGDHIGATSQHPEPIHQHNVPHTSLLASTP